MNRQLVEKWAAEELPFYGLNDSGLPMGDDDGLETVEPVENLDGEAGKDYDPLADIRGSVLTRGIYYDWGLTKDPAMYLRRPVHAQVMEYDAKLQEIGVSVRVCDGYRNWEVQRKGFEWGLGQVLAEKKFPAERFLSQLAKCIERAADGTTKEAVGGIIEDANRFFSYVGTMPYDQKRFPGVPPQFIAAAANLGILNVPLDKYARNAHASGAVVDVEWVYGESRNPVNVGVPVDLQGVESAFPFFEDREAPILIPKLRELGLNTLRDRKAYYRKAVEKKRALRDFLVAARVNMRSFFSDAAYFDQVWDDIKRTRRIMVSIAKSVGLEPYGLEAWHFDGNNERGGAHAKQLVSGAGGYARYKGQKRCAYGCATKLYERIAA